MYIERLMQIPDVSCFLLGPRGTGKTMMLKKRFPDALYLDLLDPQYYQRFLAHPRHLKELVDKLPNHHTIIIDEIQKIPALLEVVHILIEEKREMIFILTGSSARKLKKSGANLLAGRALEIKMGPFTLNELRKSGTNIALDNMLQNGLIPVVIDSKYPEKTLATYVDLYLREEILQEGLTRNIDGFARFLEAISFSHGTQLNISNVARECSIPRKSVEGYVEILKDLLIADLLPPFTKRAKRILSTRSKFYFYDTGLFRQLRPKGPLDTPAEIDGAALEGLIYQHLYAWRAQSPRKEYNLYFWRTKSGLEVDFVLYGENIFAAIEVKNGAKIRPSDLRPLKEFLKDYPQASAFLVYRGKESFVRDGITIIPASSFLEAPLQLFYVQKILSDR